MNDFAAKINVTTKNFARKTKGLNSANAVMNLAILRPKKPSYTPGVASSNNGVRQYKICSTIAQLHFLKKKTS